MLTQIIRELTKYTGDVTAIDSAEMDSNAQLAVLLGKRISDPKSDDRIDRNMKRFLSKCWNLRSAVTGAINDALDTSYGIYCSPGA